MFLIHIERMYFIEKYAYTVYTQIFEVTMSSKCPRNLQSKVLTSHPPRYGICSPYD